MTVLGAIIAGGKSSRMGGREKAFLELAGQPLISRVIARLGPHVEQLVINANGDPGRFSAMNLQVVPDRLETPSTPLAGLHAAFHAAAEAAFLITVPTDIPFLPHDLVERLVEKADVRGAAIARSNEQDHYIIGAWKTGLLASLERAIEDHGMFRVKDWARHVEAAAVSWPTDPYDPFLNVNTLDELKRAETIAGLPT